jgi:hypothetical protein
MESSPSTLAAPPHHQAELGCPLQSPPHGKASQLDEVSVKCFFGLPPPHRYRLTRSLVKPHVEASSENWFMFPP